MTYDTFCTHITNMYDKTLIHDSTQLVLASVRSGLIPLESLPEFPCPVFICEPESMP